MEVVLGPTSLGLIGCCLGGAPPPIPPASMEKWRETKVKVVVVKHLSVKKDKKIFLKYKEIQKGSGEKSLMRKGFLIFEVTRKYTVYMVRPLVIYDFAPDPF